MSTQPSFGRSGSTTKSVRNLAGPRFRTIPRLEGLEDRTAPAVITPFAPRFSTNDTGDIVFVANTVVRADPANPNAANAQNGVGSGTAINNNGYTMVNVDVDTNPTTFNSSRADLNLPAGATVLFAGLYWGAESASAARNQVLLAAPGDAYTAISGVVVGSTGTNDYQGFADVTALVQAGGNGTYTAANIQANVNATDKQGGWSLVIAYRDPAAPPRNLTVFDGFAVIQANPTADRNVTINVSGFQTPLAGPVNAEIGFITYEGDRGSSGDSATLSSGGNSQVLSDAQNPANNFFNSTISNTGSLVGTKDPNFINQLGFDADIVEANGIIPNGATSATIDLTTGGETYFPGVVTTVIDLFAPQIDTVKAVADVNGGDLEPGDILEYTVTVSNTGGDTANSVLLRDVIPANTTYVAGSLVIVAGANAGPKTDAPGDDQANFDAGGNFVQFGLGTGASGAAPGSLAIGESTTISFQVMVGANPPDGTQVTNQATVNFTGASTGVNLTDSSNPVTSVVSNQADLAVTKTISNPNPNVGELITFTVMLTNNGPQDATGVQLADQLPASLMLNIATPSQGTYDPLTGLWDVGNLANGATATLTITAVVLTPDAFVQRAQITASGQLDPDPNNNFDTVTTPPQQANLAVDKVVNNATPNVGDTVTFTVTLTNIGPDAATNVSLTDQLPAGLQFVAATPSQGSYDPVTGVWTVGTVADGAVLTLTIQALVVSPAGQTNIATIRTTDQFDPNPNNNSDDALVTPQQADLALVKTTSNPTPTVGETITYTVTLTNSGPDAASNVTVLDLLPAGVLFVSATPSQGSFDNTTGIWTVGTVAPGGTLTLQLTVVVNAAGSLVNNAEINGSDQFDPDPGNNTTNVPIIVAPQPADLGLAKTVSNPAPRVGELITYTITLSNAGPGTATSILILDILPDGLTFVSATPSQGEFDPTTNIWEVGTIASGGMLTLQLVVRVDAVGSLVNTAEITGGDSPDPNPGNNTINQTVTATPQQADLSLVKTVSNPTPNVGDTVTFTVTLTNNGPDTATGVQLTDLLPAGLELVEAIPGQGTYDPATGIWTVGAVTAGGPVTLTLRARVTSAAPATNTATVTGDQPDPDPANNTATSAVTPQIANLSVLKTVDNPTPNVGDEVFFTITLTNDGPNAATGVRLTDLLPAGLELIEVILNLGTYDPATGIWTVGVLVPGVQATLTLRVRVTSAVPVTNTATVTGDQFDPDPGNNTATATVDAVSPATPTADLVLDKQVSNPAPALSEVVTFSYTLRNQGPDAATDVVVSDPFPPGLEFVAVVSVDQGTYDPATGLWQVGTLPAGSVVTLRISARVTAVGTVVNQATASGAEFDPDLSNNGSTATQTVPPPDPSKRNLLASSPTIPVVSAPARVEDLSIEGFGVPGRVAVGAGAGDRPLVRVFDQATGAERFRFYAYDPSFTGGVAVAVGDVDGDGVDDIITGAGAGGGPHVKVFSGRDGTVLASFFAYDPSFAGGVVVAAADVNGDGVADIVTGAGPGGGPHVKVFDGRAGAEILNFFAYSADFRGGVSVAVGDLNGDGTADIITGAGAGGGPHVKVFDGSTGTERLSFFAYEAAFLGGVFVGATGPAGGPADIVTGPGLGGGPVVKRFNGRDGTEQAAVLATGMSGTAGARVAGANLTGVGAGDVLVGAGPGQDARLVLLGDLALDGIDEVLALNSNYQGGLFVAGSR